MILSILLIHLKLNLQSELKWRTALDQGKVINKLINFLELDRNEPKEWNEIGNYGNNSIKNYI